MISASSTFAEPGAEHTTCYSTPAVTAKSHKVIMWEKTAVVALFTTEDDGLVSKKSPPIAAAFTSAAQRLWRQFWDLLVLSRFTKYNPVLATLAGRTYLDPHLRALSYGNMDADFCNLLLFTQSGAHYWQAPSSLTTKRPFHRSVMCFTKPP